jgi:hypothetical protein
MSDVIVLSKVRIAFPHIKEPQTAKESGRIMYNAVFIVAPDDAGYTQFMQKVGEIALAKWKEKTPDVMNIINADATKRCYADGNTKINQTTFKVYDGYAGNVVISANNKNAPQLFDANGKQVDPNNTMTYKEEAGKIYGGCYVNAVLKPWIQQNVHGVGIRCDLVAIQFAADGESFGGSAEPDLSGMFGAVAVPAAPVAAPAGLPAFMMS